MHSITTLLSIAAFSLHILLGCSWHIAHGASEVHGSGEHSHAHHLPCSGHSEQQSDSLPTLPDSCSVQHCVYLPAGQTEISPANDVAVVPVNDQIVCGQAIAIVHEQFEIGLFKPHVRRHSALCHFLN
ncbi:hypothetical protein ETAA8_17910 [Anatilimnocola aggregata]|uniref:Uncharacterized protein n=1 Tax=Anatilimnocola aggregata TaxID=2528021 RepID=A0A517Y902_9BACT|nr:hypothetical protein [Anatilimnocola aggregata]QDU26710.1 hypothetical protein ETAA8_17910 [Anatilimnocola aggregata]